LGLSWHVPWETQDKQENLIQSSLSQAQIWTRYLPNTKLETQ
jgi:hypothetical protein